ncbi:RHS repeat domain-containing protein [Chryseobacterium indologenes]|uniref:RHS repeat domain-containing protein n=1 Tax=Chryseobacterium indologenes TaxID=253 RepID=UPI002698650A|nr:RHS repeat-associated core domain-containing protein [Chryseobacterium indologenes]
MLRDYSYQYDGLNRLTEGRLWDAMNLDRGEYTENLTYDLNGNIGTLKRKGRQFPGYTAPENMDDLAYVYSGNRLTKVDDLSLNPSGYPIGGKAFGYDDNGNMTVQEDKGLTIAYNYLNLPQSILSPQGNTSYLYSADGTKVKKTAGSKVVDYLNGFQYENNALQFFPTSEGYFDVVKNKYIYNYTDHLGNVRLSYMNNGSGVEIIEESNYYAFGLKHEGYNTSVGNAAYQYKYNGKELQETGMYDYGARFYMPDIGRWGVIDPLAEKNRRFSPYNYAINNPIRFIDPDGRSESDWIRKDGKWQYDANVTTVEQAQKIKGVDGFAENGTVFANVSVDGGAESAYAQLNAGGSITKLGADDLSSMNAIVDALPMSLGGSWTTWTQETFQIFTGGANETDPNTMNKVLPGDKLETNNMFEYILNGFNRSRTPKGEDGLYQFGIDMQGIGNPFNFKSNDSTALVEQISDSPFSYSRDTIKKVPTQTKTNDSIMFNNAVKNVNDQKLKNYYNRINFLGKKW